MSENTTSTTPAQDPVIDVGPKCPQCKKPAGFRDEEIKVPSGSGPSMVRVAVTIPVGHCSDESCGFAWQGPGAEATVQRAIDAYNAGERT